MPDPLVEAQQQEVVHPERCIQLSRLFLQRELADKVLPTLTQNPSAYRETSERFRTRQQSVEATLIVGSCLHRVQLEDQAAQMFEQAAQDAKKFRLPTLEAMAYFQLGRHALQQQKYATARESLQQLQTIVTHNQVSNPRLPFYAQLLQAGLSIELRQFDAAKTELASLNSQLKSSELPPGLTIAILTMNGDYDLGMQHQELALANYADALHLASSQDDLLAQIDLAENISRIFEQQGDLKQALHFSELACDQLQRLGNAEWLAQGLIRLAELNRQANDANLALSLLFNALDIYRTTTRPQALSKLNHEIGKTYLKLGNLAAARTYLIAAINGYKLHRDAQGELASQVTLSELYLRKNEPEMAISLLESMPAPQKGSEADLERHYLLAEAYEHKGQYLQALSHLKLFAATPHNSHLSDNPTQNSNDQFRDNYLRVELERNVDSLRNQQQQLAAERTRYLWLTAVTTLLIGVLCYVLLQMNRRQNQSRANMSQLKEQLGQAPFSHLPNQYQLHEALALLEKDPATGFCEQDDTTEYHARHFIHISIPALRRLCERVGTEKAEQLQQALTDKLIALCATDEQLYQLAESRFLLLQPHTAETTLVASAEAWSARLTPLLMELQLDSRVVMGLVHFPFLTRCPRAVGSQQVVELSLITLAAADQIAEKCQQTSWVELSAIDCQQAAFFNGVFRTQALRAIDKGLVKVNALHGKHLIDWQQIV